jgi:hypothetical protein
MFSLGEMQEELLELAYSLSVHDLEPHRAISDKKSYAECLALVKQQLQTPASESPQHQPLPYIWGYSYFWMAAILYNRRG